MSYEAVELGPSQGFLPALCASGFEQKKEMNKRTNTHIIHTLTGSYEMKEDLSALFYNFYVQSIRHVASTLLSYSSSTPHVNFSERTHWVEWAFYFLTFAFGRSRFRLSELPNMHCLLHHSAVNYTWSP